MIPGVALDLTIVAPDDGFPWDSNGPSKANKTRRCDRDRKTVLIICSPMRTAPSSMNRNNFRHMSPEDVRMVAEYGKTHLEFCMELSRIKYENGLYSCSSIQMRRVVGVILSCRHDSMKRAYVV